MATGIGAGFTCHNPYAGVRLGAKFGQKFIVGWILAPCYLLKSLALCLCMHQNRACSKKGQVLSNYQAEYETDGQAKGTAKGAVEGAVEGGLDVGLDVGLGIEAHNGPLSPVQSTTRKNA